MKLKLFPLLIAFLIGSLTVQAQNPYKEFGIEVEPLTLSKGKYNEFFTNDSLVQIGSIILDTRNNGIVGFVIYDTTYSEATLEPEVSSRFLSPDPYAAMYPNVSPYTYALNNPLIYIDPDGRQVRCVSQEDCQTAADDINETHEGAGVEVLERTREKKNFWGKTVGEETYYVLSTGSEDYDWGTDEYSSAVYDALASEETIFDVVYTQENIPFSDYITNRDPIQKWGGGFTDDGGFFSQKRGATIYIDPRGNQNTGEPSSVILMHEMVGHGHPAGGNDANTVNAHYINKLGLKNVNTGSRKTPNHGGYRGIKWKQINLFKQ